MKCFFKYLSFFLLMFLTAGMVACGGGGGGGGGGDDPAVIQENYSKIATAYSEAISSATESTVNNSNSYHVVTTLHNTSDTVRLRTEVCMNSDNELQGILGAYIFNNYTASNGVILNGILEYYTIGTESTVFVLTGTITATGSANGSYIYNVLNNGGTLSGYVGITGYYYNYSTNATSSTEPDYDVPEKPDITYYCPGLDFTLINGDTEYRVSKGTADTSNGICIPATYNEKNVTTIADNAFSNCSDLTSIIIPEGITSIGENAFDHCSKLSTVALPDSITIIGANAFKDCCALTSITLPVSITTIGDSAFLFCTKLSTVTIPKNVSLIGDKAFANIKGPEINVNPENMNFKSISGVLFNKSGTILMQMPGRYRDSYTIPSTVTSINKGAFYYSDVSGIIMPNSVTTIGDEAFYSCRLLATISLSNNLISIGNDAFWSCDSLINVSIPTGVKTIGAGAFAACYYLNSISIPDTVTTIGNGAFGSCWTLTTITIPGNVTDMGYLVFSGCTQLTEVIMNPSTPPDYDYSYEMFYYCSSLTSIKVPSANVDDYKNANGWSDYKDIIVSQ